MFIDFGASIPILHEFGPIRTMVIAISSPIKIRSLVRRESTSMTHSFVKFVMRSTAPDSCGAYRLRATADLTEQASIPARTYVDILRILLDRNRVSLFRSLKAFDTAPT